MSRRYYDERAKAFYEMNMGSMIDDVYTSRFLELLRYVPFLRDEKEKIQKFISGFPITLRVMGPINRYILRHIFLSSNIRIFFPHTNLLFWLQCA